MGQDRDIGTLYKSVSRCVPVVWFIVSRHVPPCPSVPVICPTFGGGDVGVLWGVCGVEGKGWTANTRNGGTQVNDDLKMFLAVTAARMHAVSMPVNEAAAAAADEFKVPPARVLELTSEAIAACANARQWRDVEDERIAVPPGAPASRVTRSSTFLQPHDLFD